MLQGAGSLRSTKWFGSPDSCGPGERGLINGPGKTRDKSLMHRSKPKRSRWGESERAHLQHIIGGPSVGTHTKPISRDPSSRAHLTHYKRSESMLKGWISTSMVKGRRLRRDVEWLRHSEVKQLPDGKAEVR